MSKVNAFLVVLLSALLVACGGKEESASAVQPATDATVAHGTSGDGMPAIAIKNSCNACHSINKKIVGPAWMDVAKKYKGDPGAADHLAMKIKKGGAGVWGSMPMPPNSKLNDAELKELVSFVLALDK